MTASSTLPVQNPSLLPEPGPVIESPMKEVGEIEDELGQQATEKAKSFGGSNNSYCSVPRRQLSVAFADEVQGLTPSPPLSRPFQLSPSHVRRKKHLAGTNALACPHDKVSNPASASFVQPVDLGHGMTSLAVTSAPVREVREWPQIKKAPTFASLRVHESCASQMFSRSSRERESSQEHFFTPPSTRYPSTRKGRGKARASDDVYDQDASIVSENRHRALRRSCSDSSTSSKHNQSSGRSRPVARSTGRQDPASAEIFQPVAAAISAYSYDIAPPAVENATSSKVLHSLHSQPTSSMLLNQPVIRNDVAQQSRLGSERRRLDLPSIPTAEISSSRDFSSSLYSRPRSRIFRGLSKAFDGEADAAAPSMQSPVGTPRKSFSFDAGLHDMEALAEQRYVASKRSDAWTGGKREEISRLREDNEAIRKQISDLRHEFRSLKDVLLQAESHERWQECVS